MILMRIIMNEPLIFALIFESIMHCDHIVAELQIFNVTPSSGYGLQDEMTRTPRPPRTVKNCQLLRDYWKIELEGSVQIEVLECEMLHGAVFDKDGLE